MIRYKIDILKALKEKGYTTVKIRQSKILGERTLQNIRENKGINFTSLNIICNLLECNITDILEHISDTDTGNTTNTASGATDTAQNEENTKE